MEPIRAVKGMADILPEDVPRWIHVEETYRRITRRYGYGEIRLPIVEPTPLFLRSVGETSDIVEKEMYSFVDKGDQSLTLRPEGTASAARAYIQHAVHSREPTTKWIYVGPMYRRERPAKGRYRQFHQLGAEAFGDEGPYVDAELIAMLVGFLNELGLTDLEVLVNSLGSGDVRDRYRQALLDYLSPLQDQLSEDSQRRLERNPLRVLDSKDSRDQQAIQDAPAITSFLGDSDRDHFEQLQECLTRLKVSFRVEPRIVRGLDYYTRTLFEVRVRSDQLGAQNTICGGGRYDELVRTLGGTSVPAIGFAIGIERILAIADPSVLPSSPTRPIAFVITASPELRADGLELMQTLRAAGLSADADFRGNSLKSQMRRADKAEAWVALVLGEDEKAASQVTVRDLRQSSQTTVSQKELVAYLRNLCTTASSETAR